MVRAQKEHEYAFSHRAFSRRAGLKSTNFLKLVMDGKRNLSADAALRFARAFGLSQQESEFFCELVCFTQARTARERSLSYDRLLKLKPQRALRELDVQQAAYLLVADAHGVLRPVDDDVTTGLAPLGHQIADYHRAMLERAAAAIDLFPRDEREIASLTLCVDEDILPELKARLVTFRRELMLFAEQSGDRKRVIQINFQLFPPSRKEK